MSQEIIRWNIEKAEELLNLIKEYPVAGSLSHVEKLHSVVDEIESLLLEQTTQQEFKPEAIPTRLEVRHLQPKTFTSLLLLPSF